MLQELKPNEEIIYEAWKTFCVEGFEDAPEEEVKTFCLTVFDSLSKKLSSTSIYKWLALNRSNNIIGEDQLKNKIKNQVRQETWEIDETFKPQILKNSELIDKQQKSKDKNGAAPWYVVLISQGRQYEQNWKQLQKQKEKLELSESFQPDLSTTKRSVLWFKQPMSLKVEVVKEGYAFDTFQEKHYKELQKEKEKRAENQTKKVKKPFTP